ncbi:MAG: type III secretion system cytoplasmic ring protein SctQ [Acidobacteria bacterium]|nr:type III secretion system cytoplasmic ring protein SctQ [Acidobacteriota bacterium]
MLQTAKPLSFSNLEFYTPNEVLLWNACCRLLPAPSGWKEAIAEVFGRVLERPGGHKLTLVQTHSIEPASGTREHTFDATEITLGRNPENDVVLSANSVSKQHARLLFRDGDYHLEDLGSRMGTFINKKRLSEHLPVRLQVGDQFSLFPYNFSFKLEKVWISDTQVDLLSGGWRACLWEDFLLAGRSGERSFQIEVSPASASVFLRVEERWVEELLHRLLAPLGVQLHQPWLTAPDYGFLEFVLLSVLERVQREIVFPFHFSLTPESAGRKQAAQSRGMTNSFTLALPGVTGIFRAFVPMDLIASVQRRLPARTEYRLPASIRWRFPLTLGQIELTADELETLETSDVVLFKEVAELLFPPDGRRGWRGSLQKAEIWHFRVRHYFERSCRMESKSESETRTSGEAANPRPDFSQLPVLLHVVLGEKEMSLAEANGLVPGSIIELEAREGEPVDLAINGKRVGKGELVNVEGKLGVKILNWRSN